MRGFAIVALASLATTVSASVLNWADVKSGSNGHVYVCAMRDIISATLRARAING